MTYESKFLQKVESYSHDIDKWNELLGRFLVKFVWCMTGYSLPSQILNKQWRIMGPCEAPFIMPERAEE